MGFMARWNRPRERERERRERDWYEREREREEGRIAPTKHCSILIMPAKITTAAPIKY